MGNNSGSRIEELDKLLKNIRTHIEREFDMDVQGIEEEVKKTDKDEKVIEKKIVEDNPCQALNDASYEYLQLATELYLLARMGNDIGKVESRMKQLEDVLDSLEKRCENKSKRKEAVKRIEEAENTVSKAENIRNDHPTINDILEKLDELD